MNIIDSHIHLHGMQKRDAQLLASFEKLRTELASNGTLLDCLDVGVIPDDYQERMALCKQYRVRYFSLGIHPCYAHEKPFDDYLKSLKSVIAEALSNTSKAQKLVALGEMGIDLFKNASNIEVQKEIFKEQIRLSNKNKLPIIIHNREAQTLVMQVLKEEPAVYGGILHCFSGDVSMARELIAKGFYISFAANITYPSANNLRDIAKDLSLEYILCETDSPYLSPQGLRSTANNPCNVMSVYQTIAELKNLPIIALSDHVNQNFTNFIERSA